MVGYSTDPISENCYPGTTVLINKLDIRDEQTLNEAKTLATFINASKLEEHPLEGDFGFAHYKATHYFLFSDIYDWSGQIRANGYRTKQKGVAQLGERLNGIQKVIGSILTVSTQKAREINDFPSFQSYMVIP